MKVMLTYFRPDTGKYYTDSSYKTSRTYMHEIVSEVRNMQQGFVLPGLHPNHSHYIVHVDVPDHEHNCPTLLL